MKIPFSESLTLSIVGFSENTLASEYGHFTLIACTVVLTAIMCATFLQGVGEFISGGRRLTLRQLLFFVTMTAVTCMLWSRVR